MGDGRGICGRELPGVLWFETMILIPPHHSFVCPEMEIASCTSPEKKNMERADQVHTRIVSGHANTLGNVRTHQGHKEDMGRYFDMQSFKVQARTSLPDSLRSGEKVRKQIRKVHRDTIPRAF